ncbi:hypothetical protein LLT6_13865 [Lactococcus cremoris subsp. cremoris TIFN6]|uniref:Receptor-binding protein of phage tail base-plate Siphoviridae head domain-containing protein n=1 Tax=Lactococcus cremoris subsp. cremoris TIFN6 TaxID=1234876 RepID=T0TE33_LACLC|nr:hypothetical protein LLT6_13865 [Lactococcus cremoris subsp. cremoris TIFN6]
MSYEKQTWNKYDDLKTEEENIVNGAVVTDNRMNHIEEGIYSHTIDISNPHKVTAAQVGLGNVQNFGLATEDEAKQGISNAKYMTPSLTQAVLSANINSIAYANSADGTDRFTTVYPNLNLLNNTKIIQGNINSKIWASAAASSLSVGSNNGIKVINNGGAIGSMGGFSYIKPTNVNVGDTITVSCCIKNTGTVDIKNFSLSIAFYGTSKSYPAKGNLVIPNDGKPYFFSFTTIVPSGADTAYPRWFDTATAVNEKHIFEVEGMKLEQGSTATTYMQSASEVTTADWPKFVGFSNTVKTNKSASDYTWFPVKDSELTNKVESHINNKANPHAVTASQVGAYSKQEIDTKLSKAVMADDSGKVILKDFEVTTISETVNIGNGMSLNFQRKGEFVLVRFSGSLTAIDRGTYFSSAVPDQWRPDGIKELIGHFASGALAFHVDLETDGRVKWWGASGATGAPRGTAMYFLK